MRAPVYSNQKLQVVYVQSIQSQTECFYLRLLLGNVTRPLSFQNMGKIDGQQHTTYKDACLALGLQEDDNQWDTDLYAC